MPSLSATNIVAGLSSLLTVDCAFYLTRRSPQEHAELPAQLETPAPGKRVSVVPSALQRICLQCVNAMVQLNRLLNVQLGRKNTFLLFKTPRLAPPAEHPKLQIGTGWQSVVIMEYATPFLFSWSPFGSRQAFQPQLATSKTSLAVTSLA